MIPRAKVVIIFLLTVIFFCSGQTCRDHSSSNSAVVNANSLPATGSSANMSNQNKNENGAKTEEVVWGGPHVRLVLSSRGGEIEFDCAHGEIKEPLKFNEQGNFSVAGTFAREGGPVRHDDSGGQRARYSGRVEGDKMTLTVTLADSNEKLDEFSLKRGSDGRLWKCK